MNYDLVPLSGLIQRARRDVHTVAFELRELRRDVPALADVPVFAGRLGRHIEHDVRSLEHIVDAGLALTTTIRPVRWERFSPILDQGDVGSCTGNAMTGWLGCAPHCVSAVAAAQYDEPYALRVYELATQLDAFPGTYPPDDTGSSGLAVAKAAQQLHQISAYHWARTTAGLLRALMHQPVIVGITWYSSFDTPAANGTVTIAPDAYVRGGHEVLVRGYDTTRDALLCDNSWGPGFGLDGSFWLPIAVWNKLRTQGADVIVPVV
jgi:papain like protease